MSYMEIKVGDQKLSYRSQPGTDEQKALYDVLLGREKIAEITMENADPDVLNWQLSGIQMDPEPELSYQVRCMENHKVFVNGVPLEDAVLLQKTGRKLTDALGDMTAAAEIPNSCLYDMGKFLAQPQVDIENEAGELVEVAFDPETGIFSEDVLEGEIPSEARNLAMEAVTTYCEFMIQKTNRATLSKYFKPDTPTFRAITGSDLSWIQKERGHSTANEQVYDYVKLSDTSFAIRVSLTWQLIRKDDSLKESPVDVSLLFEQERSGKWRCVRMSGVRFLEPFNTVRVRFLRHENVLDTVMFHSGDETITYPQVEVPDGKILAGWVAVWQDENGEDYYQRVLKADDSRTVPVPDGVFDGPVDLRPVFAKK